MQQGGLFSPDSGDWKSAVWVEPRFIGFEFIALAMAALF